MSFILNKIETFCQNTLPSYYSGWFSNPQLEENLISNQFEKVIGEQFSPPLDEKRVTLRPLSPSSGLRDYDSLLQELREGDPLALEKLEMKIKYLLSLNKKGIEQLSSLIKSQNWDSPLFDQIEETLLYALEGVKEGVLNIEEYALLTFKYAAEEMSQSHEAMEINAKVHTIPLFNQEGKLNSEAESFIWETLNYLKDVDNEVYLNTKNFEKKLPEFFEKMKSEEISQQQFFIVDDHHLKQPDLGHSFIKLKQMAEKSCSIADEILFLSRFNCFGRLKEERKRLMIPSPGMMRQFLEVIFEQNAVKIDWLIGLASLERIQKGGRNHSRVFSLFAPGILFPKKADGFRADLKWYFMLHDWYHTVAASHIPTNEQKAFVAIAKEVKCIKEDLLNGDDRLIDKLSEKYSDEQTVNLTETLSVLYEYLIDMDHNAYRREKNSAFSLALSELPLMVFAKLIIKNLEKEFENKEKDENEEIEKRLQTIVASCKEKFFSFYLSSIPSALSDRLSRKKEKFLSYGIDLNLDFLTVKGVKI